MAQSPFSVKLRASLELMRPPNIVTAFADILAGAAAAAGVSMLFTGGELFQQSELLWLLLSTFGLYGGGIVFNDVFDARLDAEERPERPIPSGRVSKTFASILGALLIILGILSAFMVNQPAGMLALLIAACALYYDARAKHSVLFGPLYMGLCRGGNLMLGAAILPGTLTILWPLVFIPVAYIGAITLISQGEVKGGSKTAGYLAAIVVTLIFGTLLLLAIYFPYSWLTALPFAVLFAGMVIPPFFRAAKNPKPGTIKKAVKRGVLSLIILNSALAAGFAGIWFGLGILLLLPISIACAKLFAVT